MKKYDCGIAVADEHVFEKLRNCWEVSLSSCGIAIMDFKKRCACPPRIWTALSEILQQLIGVCLVCKLCFFLFHMQHAAIPLAKNNYHCLNVIWFFCWQYTALYVARSFYFILLIAF
jgi:hypothetical protein